MQGWHLDKDAICPECQIYSPDTCCIIPSELNLIMKGLLTKIGVIKTAKGFVAMVNGKRIGSFGTYEEAVNAYKEYKIKHIHLTLDKYRDVLKPEVYTKIKNFKFV